MDPTAAYAAFLSAIADNDLTAACDAATDLRGWLNSGGVVPRQWDTPAHYSRLGWLGRRRDEEESFYAWCLHNLTEKRADSESL